MKLNQILATGLLAAASIGTAEAATVEFLPSGGSAQNVSANVPQFGNVWAGVGQSFTAVDQNIEFGFYMYSNEAATQNLVYSLYEGEGSTGTLLGTVSASFEGGGGYFAPELATADFSTIDLTVGGNYTIFVSMASGLPSEGNYSTALIEYASTSTSVYDGGRFYYTGSSYDDSSAWAGRDIAFRMTGVTPVPEASTWAMMIFGLGAAGMTLRRRSALVQPRLA